jgi:hypothetical protein
LGAQAPLEQEARVSRDIPGALTAALFLRFVRI